MLTGSSATIDGHDALPTQWRVPPGVFSLDIRGEVLWAYVALLQLIDANREVLIDFLLFGQALGASERSARRWVDSLRKAGLAEILDRSPRGARVRLNDWRFCTPPATARADQRRFEFAADESAGNHPTILSLWGQPTERSPTRGGPEAG